MIFSLWFFFTCPWSVSILTWSSSSIFFKSIIITSSEISILSISSVSDLSDSKLSIYFLFIFPISVIKFCSCTISLSSIIFFLSILLIWSLPSDFFHRFYYSGILDQELCHWSLYFSVVSYYLVTNSVIYFLYIHLYF